MTSPQLDQPVRVLRGDPTEEELAALLAVLRARAGAASAEQEHKARQPRRAVSAWRNPSHTMPRRPVPGPGAWRSSAWG